MNAYLASYFALTAFLLMLFWALGSIQDRNRREG